MPTHSFGKSRHVRRHPPTVVAAALVLFGSAIAAAFEAQVSDLRIVGQNVRVSFHLRDAFPRKFRAILQEGAPLYLRLETELWEDRPVWDRLAGPAVVVSFRLTHDRAAQQITITDEAGDATLYPAFPDPLQVGVRVARAERVADNAEYYISATVTIGTIDERDIEGAGDAVFGRESDSSVTAIGRLFLRKVLQLNEYLQSVSTKVTSRKYSGRQVKSTK